jgi:hypothetical protein
VKIIFLVVVLACWSLSAAAENVTQSFCKALSIDVQKEQRRWLELQGKAVEADFLHRHAPSSSTLAASADTSNRLAEYTKSITDNGILWTAYCKS